VRMISRHYFSVSWGANRCTTGHAAARATRQIVGAARGDERGAALGRTGEAAASSRTACSGLVH